MSREEFLDCSPRELEAFFRRLEVQRDEVRFGSALVASTICNVYRDQEKCPEPFQPIDFMPGKARKRSRIADELLEEHIPTDEDKSIAASFVAQLQKTFNPERVVKAVKT